MAGHAQLKFVMRECSKTQIRLTGLNFSVISATLYDQQLHDCLIGRVSYWTCVVFKDFDVILIATKCFPKNITLAVMHPLWNIKDRTA